MESRACDLELNQIVKTFQYPSINCGHVAGSPDTPNHPPKQDWTS